MKILVTGGAGFIGSALIRLAIAREHSVVNADA
ncbi:NAD-dependent epimerase/dehydratase family protein, partial [bacterium]|nr:NAD-dependent epimerase/dehydratase family protein [bacterium]